MGTGLLYVRGGNPAMHMDIQGRVQFLLVASCYRYQDKLRLYVWATSLTQCLPTFHSVTTITGVAGVTVCFSYLHHLISFLFFFFCPIFPGNQCIDRSQRCDEFKRNGLCSQHADNMLYWCTKTCDLCSSGAT